MAFTSITYRNARDSAWQKMPFSKAAITTIAGRTYSTWKAAGGDPGAGANPGGTAIAYTSATAGALGDIGGGGGATSPMRDSAGVARIVKMAVQFASTPGTGLVQVCDRISGISGFSAVTTGTVTCNTTTPSRYATGAESRGILAAIEVYTAMGNTASCTVNMSSYTDQDGTTAQVGTAIPIAATGFTEVQRFMPLPLVSGGFGVRSVETLNRVTAAGTAGDYGVTVYKPLVTIPVHALGPAPTEEEEAGMGFIVPKVVAGACLFMVLSAGATSTGVIHGELSLGEE